MWLKHFKQNTYRGAPFRSGNRVQSSSKSKVRRLILEKIAQSAE